MSRPQKSLELATDAANQAKLIQQELGRLQRQLKRQRVITQALWQILREKFTLSEEDLARLIAQIERLEKEKPQIAELCPHCGRSLQDDHTTCIYCGAEVARRDLF